MTRPALGDLRLVAPAPVGVVVPERARRLVPVAAELDRQLEQRAQQYAASVLDSDPGGPDLRRRAAGLSVLGDREIRAAAETSARMLERPARAAQAGGTSPIGMALVDLREAIDHLKPSRQGLAPRKLFGVISLGDRMHDYFDRYRASQARLDAIIRALLHGQDELRKDNAAIEQEKSSLWTVMGRLQQYAVMCEYLVAELEQRLAGIEATDPEHANTLRREVVFIVHQKHQDLLTQLAVASQGTMALDLVCANNAELIKGVDRATTTTIAALRTAVLVAQALASEQLVLDQISALNASASDLAQSASGVLRGEAADLDELEAAFRAVYATMDAIDTFKVQAQDSMKATVGALGDEIARARAQLGRPGGETTGGALVVPA